MRLSIGVLAALSLWTGCGGAGGSNGGNDTDQVVQLTKLDLSIPTNSDGSTSVVYEAILSFPGVTPLDFEPGATYRFRLDGLVCSAGQGDLSVQQGSNDFVFEINGTVVDRSTSAGFPVVDGSNSGVFTLGLGDLVNGGPVTSGRYIFSCPAP